MLTYEKNLDTNSSTSYSYIRILAPQPLICCVSLLSLITAAFLFLLGGGAFSSLPFLTWHLRHVVSNTAKPPSRDAKSSSWCLPADSCCRPP